jgi:hypothetical protein
MSSGLTSPYLLPYPLQTDPVDVASDVEDLAVAVNTQLLLKSPILSPTFTGVASAVTAGLDTNTTQIATTQFVINQGYLKTSTAASTYAALASPTFTGNPLVPTQTAGDNSTRIASTAFVTNAVLSADYVTPTGVQTVSNKTLTLATLTTPTINGATLSGTLSGNHTLSGDTTFSGSNAHTGNLSVTGRLDLLSVRESVKDSTISANLLIVDYISAGNLAYIASAPSANFTINVTNAPTDNSRAITIVVMVTQGATGYIPSVFQVEGSAQTIKWLAGSAPTPTSSSGKIDVFNFTMIRRSSAWTILGNAALNF